MLTLASLFYFQFVYIASRSEVVPNAEESRRKRIPREHWRNEIAARQLFAGGRRSPHYLLLVSIRLTATGRQQVRRVRRYKYSCLARPDETGVIRSSLIDDQSSLKSFYYNSLDEIYLPPNSIHGVNAHGFRVDSGRRRNEAEPSRLKQFSNL